VIQTLYKSTDVLPDGATLDLGSKECAHTHTLVRHICTHFLRCKLKKKHYINNSDQFKVKVISALIPCKLTIQYHIICTAAAAAAATIAARLL
jgi:hypothetical protein